MCACTWYIPAQAMSLYRYFKPTLPSPSGPLAESINPATIKAANEAVKDATSKPSKARGSYHVRIIRIILYPLYIRACARAPSQFSRLGIQVSLAIICLFVWAMVWWVALPFFSFLFFFVLASVLCFS